MKLIRNIIFLILVPGCYAKSQKEFKSGRLISNFEFFDTATNKPSLSMRTNVWFIDSLAIEEIIATNINTDTNHVTTIDCEVMHYMFIDLKTGMFYKYGHFSDTAKVIASYKTLAEAKSPHWLWDFRYNKRMKSLAAPEKMPDTTIDGILYHRNKLIIDIGKGPFENIKYLRCDQKGILITLPKQSGDETRCAVLRSYSQRIGGTKVETGSRLEFVSEKLTDEELKVFAAWEKYAKEHPLK